MFKTTGWRLPLVFDTLLGRLDNTHKNELISHFIPSCGEQVIILATDSEITSEHWSLIQPVINTCYTLDFNLEDERTIIVNNQFFEHIFRELELIK
jgi:DNA sulfur modification protein DndD